MLVRITKGLPCLDRVWGSYLENVPRLMTGTVIDLGARKTKLVTSRDGGTRRRKVVEFCLGDRCQRLYALVGDVQGAYKKVPLHKIR
jgi:hypothetical protein